MEEPLRRSRTTAVLLTVLAFAGLATLAGGHSAAAQTPSAGDEPDAITLNPGSGSFGVDGGQGYPNKRIRVHYHMPESFHESSPVLMVIPGAGRNGDDYRDAWVEASERFGVLVLAPSYSERYYPEYWSYNLAGMTRQVTLDLSFVIDTKPQEWKLAEVVKEVENRVGGHGFVGHSSEGQLIYQLVLLARSGMLEELAVEGTDLEVARDPEAWIFDDFDRIFARVKGALGLEAERYDMFGHSAGGQILHRTALFHPRSQAHRILAANSGWYTLPTFEHEFPYGLKGTGRTAEELKDALQTELVVFLGEEDDADETRGSLRRTPQADLQGTHRLARGRFFFDTARQAAAELDTELSWTLEVVPDVGHDHERMSEAAAEYLYGGGGR